MATENRQSLVKVKPSQDGYSSMKIKRTEIAIKPLSDSKTKSVSTVTKAEVKLKPASGSSKTTTKTTTRVREKKVFSLPGQKYDPPEEREPLRIFYESLSKQIPSSEMAEFWMMEHGLLSPDKAKRAYEKKQRKQKMQRMGTPIKSTKAASKPESSLKQQQASKNGEVKVKKRMMNDSDNDDEFLISAKRRKE